MDSQMNEHVMTPESEDEFEVDLDEIDNDAEIELTEERVELDDDLDIDDDENISGNLTWKKNGRFLPFVAPPLHEHSKINEDSELSEESTPLEILKSMVTRNMVATIVEESNRYAFQVNAKKPTTSFKNWKPINENEFWTFFAVQLMMGIVRKPSLKDYWANDVLLSTPGFSRTMSRNRYEDILRSLHFANNDDAPGLVTDRFIKLGSFMSDLLQNYASTVQPGEYLCIDESLMIFKGRLSFKQFNPKKRARFGIKFFVLADCDFKFVLGLIPYQGKKTQLLRTASVKDLGFGGAAVLTLLDSYENKGHKIVIDNWFLSPNLAKSLLAVDTYVFGTVQKKRKGMPKMTTKLKKGEVEVYSDSQLLVERWLDRREVVMLNTFMPHEMLDSISSNPRNTREKPSTVLLYNKTMGALDDIDQQIKSYQTIRKTIKWYKKVFFHLMDLSVHNTFILYQRLLPGRSITYLKFIKNLINEILEQHSATARPKGRPAPRLPEVNSRLTGLHLPFKNLTTDGKSNFSNCAYCRLTGTRKMTCFSCSTCKKRFCIQNENSCFSKYHTQRVLPKKPIRRSSQSASSSLEDNLGGGGDQEVPISYSQYSIIDSSEDEDMYGS